MAAALVLGGAGLFGGASTASAEPWILAPASSNARLINELFWLTLVLAGVVFVLVEGLLLYSSLRFRRRAPLPVVEPPQVHGNTRLEVMWAIVPALILIGLFGVSVRTLNALGTVPPDAMRIQVEAYQFGWDFNYVDSQVRSTGDLRLPVGVPVVFEVTSRDVIHSFWVPDLGGKIDANPGRTNRLWVQAEKPGRYRGVCAELCGAGHSGMLFSVEVMDRSAFEQWLTETRTGAARAAAAGPSPERGAQIFTAKGCGACHTLGAVPGASGQVGPSLNGIATTAERRKPGTSAEAYLRESIQNPAAFIAPGFPPAMPPQSVTDDELAALVALLMAQR